MTPEKAGILARAIEETLAGETYAAIALALQMHACGMVHDQESFVLTIKPTFSAWADRHSTLRQLPVRRGR
ncbi:MAG: hypothetical protein IAC29_06385 [Bacteroidetes bacterium]|uniref:Uncharacterized protein n=1 Tax=Candidatus Cryptobacteroides merdigallinarum TaxID=2840770 RepID=A0A9D9ELP3_9BACT|nr:hypothetical protein [Candidatus Cryptobacteroides merdigallinarum]